MEILFNTNQSKVVLNQFKIKIDGLTPNSDFEISRNSLIKLVIGSMANSPDQWDKNCQINIEWIGSSFINRLVNEEKELDKSRIDDICSMCFRFMFELYLSIKTDLSMEFERARKFVLNNLDSFESDSKDQIEYAIRDMPINILKQLSNCDAIDSLKDFNALSEKASKLRSEWNKELSEKEKQVQQLKDSLEKYKTAFNFVGLHDGFDDLATSKKTELNNLVFWLRIMSVIIISPILIQLIVVYFNIKDIDSIKNGFLVSIFPTLSLVAISVYYFRVLMFNYKSVKSQLLQLDLRKTLCRFIQHYTDYSQEIKTKDKDSLAKFENIIFSGIVTDDGNLPSTYDGIDQLGKLFKSVKG
jgi:hypothetical protein